MGKKRDESSQSKETTTLNEVYDTIEAILESLDAGGEQSLAFAEEIKMLKEVLGYPEPAEDALAETLRRCQIARKLERLAIQAEDITVTLPALAVAKWFDGTFADATVEVPFEECSLARLLQFIADYGVGEQSGHRTLGTPNAISANPLNQPAPETRWKGNHHAKQEIICAWSAAIRASSRDRH